MIAQELREDAHGRDIADRRQSWRDAQDHRPAWSLRARTGSTSRKKLGSLIGAAFGLVFVLINTSPLATAIAVPLRVLAVVAFLAVVIALRRPGPATSTRVGGGDFSRRYWLVVAAEVLAIWFGLALLNGPLHTPHAAVAWVSSVVGAHFLALALVWRNPLFHWLGAALLGCGVVGLALAGRGTDLGLINFVGGVLPGAILLGFSLWGSTRGAGSSGARAVHKGNEHRNDAALRRASRRSIEALPAGVPQDPSARQSRTRA